MGDDRNEGAARNPWTEALEGLVRGVRSTVDFQRRVVSGSMQPTDMSAAYLRFIRSELSDYGRTVAELTVDYYRDLADAATAYGERFYEEMAAEPDDDGPLEDERQSERERATIGLVGESGTEIVASFTLENRDPAAASVTVEPGPCRGPDGESFTAPLTVEPASLTIPPEGSAEVTLRLRLESDLFTPGVTYRLPLEVRGPRPASVDVHIQATAAREVVVTETRGRPYVVECPVCSRTFERKTDNLVLRPHKNPAGEDCPGRDGFPPT